MDNNEIFRLLILILLFTNGSNAEAGQTGNLTNINQLILALLLINPPSNDNDGCCCGNSTFDD
ncbi:MAG: hypothetical protein IJD07_04730 [Clostridia bacterium]|nr:hypothetical protein [Clostridia bacterium]